MHARARLDGDDELAREPGGAHAAQVEGEGHALVVPRLAARDVGHDRRPVRARARPAASAARSGSRAPPGWRRRRSARRSRRGSGRRRGRGSARRPRSERHFSVRPPSARRFQVPTRRLRSSCFAGIGGVERGAEREEPLGERRRKWIGDAGRGPQVLPRRSRISPLPNLHRPATATPYPRFARAEGPGAYGRSIDRRRPLMARKHAFFIVVLLAAAALAGFVALCAQRRPRPAGSGDGDPRPLRSPPSRSGSASSTVSRRSSASSWRRSRPPAQHSRPP